MNVTAEKINDHLKSGGVVQVATYGRSTVYESKNAGQFSELNGELFVARGKRLECLGRTERPLVAIRFGRYV